MVTKKIITTLSFLTIFCCATASTATDATTQGRTITFKPTDKTFTEFSKGIVDINVNRQIAFDTSVDLSTGILKSKWKNEQPITTKIPEVRGPDSLINAEVLIAKPVFDKEWKKVEGYYFVIYLSRWSTAKNGRGNCGSGVENELIVLLTDTVGNLSVNDSHLVNSCLEPVGSLFIRDSAPENIIYVIYYESGDVNLLKIDYLYPRKAVAMIKGKMVPRVE